MQLATEYIRGELRPFYPAAEIEPLMRLIFAHLRGYGWHELLINMDKSLSADERLQVAAIVSRLQQYEPVQYVLGATEFYGLPFRITPDVLIPRPETEELVDWLLHSPLPENVSVLDACTGSGCIAVAIAKQRPAFTVAGCDISDAALAIARENATKNATNVTFFNMDILKPAITPHYDVIISNPPYLTTDDKALMPENVLNFEPHQALFTPSNEPLQFYRALADMGMTTLSAGGCMFLEINELYGAECVALLRTAGYASVELRPDINGKPRMIRAVAHAPVQASLS
ncbi:MAG: peptide chain release factor N(5)-glutamine methyltransferase [Bacteroidales bacterium]|jgi:release factor glutamine methyltransferase|nr:peptide chain release factor N(5)-glutamine methyltransferase [Bacteroidales bacterium]